MSKVRVYELARELKLESKALMAKLQSLGIEVQTHQSTLSVEQVTAVRKSVHLDSIQSEASGQKNAGAPQRVIRRRRAESTEAEATPAQAELSEDLGATAASVAPQVPVVTPAAPEGLKPPEIPPPPLEAKEIPEAPAAPPQKPEPVPTVAAAPPTETPAIPKPHVESQPSAAPDMRETPKNPEPQRPVPSHPTREPQSDQNRNALPPPRRPQSSSSGGATIVRRASPEELAAARAREQERQRLAQAANPYGDRRGGGDRPRPGPGTDKSVRAYRPAQGRDGGGPGGPGGGGGYAPRDQQQRFAGPGGDRGPSGGFGGGRGGPALPPPAFPDIPTLEEETEQQRRFKKKPQTHQEAEEHARKAQAAKSKRDHLNVRSLLSNLDEEDDSAAVPEEADAAAVRKTVYTPQAATRNKRDLRRRKDLKKTAITTPRASYRVVKMGSEITIGDLAREMSVKATEIIKKLMGSGIMATINQSIDFDTASLIANDFQFEVQSNLVSVTDILDKAGFKESFEGEKAHRAPIVTIMGHVDHGKTSILDAIRKSKVAKGEAGGITQHIGAYTVFHNEQKIAFLDTPGHEAFSAMRARGAKVTDIVVLVVAADDGVMPQTKEAISHAKNAEVPIIVAINKVDKPNINLDRIMTELTEFGIQSEEWGGETQFVKVSALTGQGITELLEAIQLQAELLQLNCVYDAPAKGAVVEAHLDKGRGPVATIMVQEGTLKVGDYIVAGTCYGKARSLTDHKGSRVDSAEPSTPVEVIGLAEVPMAGDSVLIVADERMAKEISDMRKDQTRRSTTIKSSAATLDELLGKIRSAETLEVPLVVKADTQGSLEAICESIAKIGSEKVRGRVVHRGVGGISESDIMLATTTESVVIGFNVRAGRGLDDLANKHSVPIKYFSIIYEIVDAVKSLMAGKLPPIQKEVVIGHAEVRNPISIPKIGTIAGSAVMDGKIVRNAQLRLIRNDVVIYNGKVGSLRRFKDDVKEVAQGYECGIGIDGYQDLREGDVIEAFVIEELAPTL